MRKGILIISIFLITLFSLSMKTTTKEFADYKNNRLLTLDSSVTISTELNTKRKNLILDEIMSSDFSVDNLAKLLILKNHPNVEVIMQQCRTESSHYKDYKFLDYNNFTGMHYPEKRKTTATGFIYADKGKIATYDSWQDCVEDLFLYYEYWESVGYDYKTDYEQFLIDVRYCEKHYYTDVLRNIKVKVDLDEIYDDYKYILSVK